MKVLVIGGGNMGFTYAEAIAKSTILKANENGEGEIVVQKLSP